MPACVVGLGHEQHVTSGARMQGGRQAGDPGADHDDVGLARPACRGRGEPPGQAYPGGDPGSDRRSAFIRQSEMIT